MLLENKEFCKLAKQGRVKISMPMSKLNSDPFGLIFYKCSNDKKDMVECTIEKYDMFDIEEAYKVVVRAKDRRYGSENFYVSDLLSLIDSGYIKCSIVNN